MKKAFIIFWLIFLVKPIWAQVVNEPLNNDVYEYLERLSNKGSVEIDDLIKPFTRKYISEKLMEAKSKIERLTELEKEELEFYIADYFLEIEGFDEKNKNEKYLSYFEGDASNRFRFFSYSDKIFKLNASPILGFNIDYPEKETIKHLWLGINTYGYLLNNIGYSLYFKTNNEVGNELDTKKYFTPETGILPEIADNGKDIVYSEFRSSISADWEWGNAVIAKDFMEYGYAKMGNLVLSNKAPSFPYISLKVKPVDWFSFTYFHAWLSSTIIDSVELNAYHRDIFRPKYFAWHAITLTPLNGLDISIGESVVYDDKIEFLYLMPISIFYLADQYISNRENKPGDANQQIFLTLSSKDHVMNTHIYGTLFIDELTLGGAQGPLSDKPSDYYSNERDRTQLGFTLGLSLTDLPINNLTVSTEYTRINPFVYGHHDTVQTYTSSGYLMGHWMGHNSDLFYMDIGYRFLRGLKADVWGAYIRKGSSDYSKQYEHPQPEFLFGLRTNYKYLGFNLKYELIHELFFETRYKMTETSSEQSDGSFIDDRINEFAFSIYYGL
jgi:hypothetical protein